MPIKALFRCAVVAAIAVPLCVHAEPFNVKAGAWEMTTTTVSTGMIATPEILAHLTPEQRAEMERVMNTRSGKPSTSIIKSCFTQQNLDQDALIAMGYNGNCTQKVSTKTSTRIRIERACPAPKAYTSIQIFEAATPESFTITSDLSMQSGGKVQAVLKAKWLSASCEGIPQ